MPVAVEFLEPRVFLSAALRTIAGAVFYDLRGNGKKIAKDHWLKGVQVFLDLNNNGVLDPGEPSTLTNKAGAFTFKRLPVGTYRVMQIPLANEAPTVPAAGTLVVTVRKHSALNLRFADEDSIGPPVFVGGSNGVTNQNNATPSSALTFDDPSTVPGATLILLADGAAVGSAAAVSTDTKITTNGEAIFADGPHQFVLHETLPDKEHLSSPATTVTIQTAGPTGTLTAMPLTTAGATSYTFSVTWQDATEVSVASLGNNLVVTGPGFLQTAVLISLDGSTDGLARTATYQLNAASGMWTAANNGTYTVSLLGGKVMDELGNASAAGVVGTFSVAVSGS